MFVLSNAIDEVAADANPLRFSLAPIGRKSRRWRNGVSACQENQGEQAPLLHWFDVRQHHDVQSPACVAQNFAGVTTG